MEVHAKPKGGEVLDATRTMYPSRLMALVGGSHDVGSTTSTTYGYVVAKSGRIRGAELDVTLNEGSFFALPGPVAVEAAGTVITIERFGFRALPLVGRIEERGRLAYIDGCSDTILCMPPRLGDPVLNHLHFPAGIVQTPHSHPSIRLGVVARGRGIAYSPARDGRPGWELALETGTIFCLVEHELHAFKTTRGESMDVIAFHPDSDWGPTDGVHPMLNRTYLGAAKA